MFKRLLAPLLAALFAVAAACAADDGSDILNKMINKPSVDNWSVQGLSQPAKIFDDATVQGGSAVRIPVPGKGDNPWDISANMAIAKPVAKGDVVLVAFWARAETPAEGKQTAILAAIRVQQTSAPYAAFAEDQTEIGSKWTMVYASGVADQDYDKGTLGLTVQLAAAEQVVDLGPCFILDFGPNYDKSKLPHNALVPSAAPASGPPQQAAPSLAQAEANFAPDIAKIRAMLPVAGRLMNDPAVTSVLSYGSDQNNQFVDAPDISGGKALRVASSKAGGEIFSVGTSTPIYGDIRKGDVVFFAFYARATEASTEGQYGVISAINVQQNATPWTIAAGSSVQVPLNAWRMFYIWGISPIDIPSGGAVLSAQIGGRKQSIDFGPAFVLNLGQGVDTKALPVNKITYLGRGPDAAWRQAAAERIRQIRMGDFTVAVTDASGKPVPDAEVHFAMTKHRYRFGGFAGFDLTSAQGPAGDAARAVFLKTFNFATAPIYWSDWGWADPKMHQNMIDTMAWLQAHGYSFRAHPVIYPREDLTPGYVKNLAGAPVAAQQAVLDHVRDVVPIVARYGACCTDVVNEPQDGQYLPSIAGPDIFDQAFRVAHQMAPDLHLFINDYSIVSGGGINEKMIAYYHKFIEDMLAKGVPLSGIGIQAHFGADLTDPARVLAIIDGFAKYRLPIEITEFDVDTADEAAQADYTRDMLTAVFSDPNTDAFVTWGWRDPPPSNLAMFRPDWSLKPNGEEWMKLIYHDWWTDETRSTAADGKASIRAFYGDYRVAVTAGGHAAERSVSFAPGSGPVTVALP